MTETHKLVPLTATEEMIRVGFELALGTDDEQPSIADVWRAMVEASPTPEEAVPPLSAAERERCIAVLNPFADYAASQKSSLLILPDDKAFTYDPIEKPQLTFGHLRAARSLRDDLIKGEGR